ncbi:MAG: hypothetical protein LBE35_09360 [Clostridiales bacterium]|nr:hypothetical protein [Clostridiales bacterium]
MTVSELLEKLKTMPQDAQVVTPFGGDGRGYDTASEVVEFDMLENIYTGGYGGAHEALNYFNFWRDEGEELLDTAKIVKAVCICCSEEAGCLKIDY